MINIVYCKQCSTNKVMAAGSVAGAIDHDAGGGQTHTSFGTLTNINEPFYDPATDGSIEDWHAYLETTYGSQMT